MPVAIRRADSGLDGLIARLATLRLVQDRLVPASRASVRANLTEGPRLVAQEPTLIQIRERSYLDLLDLALLVVRHRPRRLALAAAIGHRAVRGAQFLAAVRPGVPRALWPVLLFLEAPWATAPLTVVLGGLMFGQPPAFGSVLRRLVRGPACPLLRCT